MKDVPTSKSKAVIYARVSSKEQEREGFSIPAQLKMLKEYAQAHRFEIVREFIDSETAGHAGRKFFGEMVKVLENGDIRTLLAEKTDRLYRNIKDWVILDDLVREHEIDVHLVKEGKILSRHSGSSDNLAHGVHVVVAKYHLDNLREEVTKGMHEKAAQGVYPSMAPLGYRNVQSGGQKFIEPDPETAPIIHQLFERYDSGNYSLDQLTSQAYLDGLRSKNGGRVHKSIIHALLNNPIYHGEFKWGGKLYKGTHRPIVSRALFNHVQIRLQGRGHRKSGLKAYQWTFQGMVSCGRCGYLMIPEIKKGKYVYYHCAGDYGRCAKEYVREEKIAWLFREALERIHFDQSSLEWLQAVLREQLKEEKQHHEQAIHALEVRRKKLYGRIEKMYKDKLDDKISEEIFEKLYGEWHAELEVMTDQMEKHKIAGKNYYDEVVEILELAHRAVELYDRQEMMEKRKLLKFVFSNSSYKEGVLDVQYRKPFDLLADMSEVVRQAVDVSRAQITQSSILVPPTGLEPVHPAPEAGALST